MKRLLLIAGIAMLLLAVALPGLAGETVGVAGEPAGIATERDEAAGGRAGTVRQPVGITVERADSRLGIDQCKYCGKIFRPGPVHRAAEMAIEDTLKEKMREKGIPYTEGKEYKRSVHVYVYRYEERRGGNFAAERPASVGFHVHLMAGDSTVKVYEFDETQRALTENLLGLGKLIQRGGKWVTAEQLAGEGLDSALNYIKEALEE
jgi:hypothetical protein